MIAPSDRPVADAARGNWVDIWAPLAIRPYLRLARIDRPIGWWLLVLPCWWSTALAADAIGQPYPDPVLLVLFWIGAVAMRGAGSTYNDIVDRDIDRRVERTRQRPVASGAVSATAASAFCAVQCLIGLSVLVNFPVFAIFLAFLSLIPVAIYPFMKRVTSWPQAVLGLAFSWGALMGWAVVTNGLGAPAFWLYAAAIVWTMGYDTIYAVQDIEDDILVGVGSTARFFGQKTQFAVFILYSGAVFFTFLAFLSANVGALAYAALLVFAVFLGRQAAQINLTDGAKALRLFQSNKWAGLVLFAGLVLDTVARH
jgi:4-hydroxybenzoate polyprenyltransferase